MGKYTSLARKFRDDGPRGEADASSTTILNVNINSIDINRDKLTSKPTSARPEDTVQSSPPVEKLQTRASGGEATTGEHTTSARTTNLTNLTKATNLIGAAE